ncbi:flagellar protein [Butyrivibrio sp. MC2013]|uniref:flagellar protein n=1 Tax=Butyrivibrio sp. MC2013 TaxID=1280686 RepID=UPI00040AD388|nr:flagellar protein [Butyrivibrio sp. MC2013]
MNLRNCPKCGKMFNYVAGPPICDDCRKRMEDDFQKVKTYIQENPLATLKEISEANEVKVGQIKEWIRQERLMFSKDSPIKLTCENCGELIETGRFCAKCKGKVANNLTDAFKKEAPQIKARPKDDKGGMRFF